MQNKSRKRERNSRPITSDGWIDVSVTLTDGMVHWPGDPDVQIRRIEDMDKGDICNVTHISMSAHTGTHMDAPSHFIKSKPGMDKMPLSATMGQARVIEIKDPVQIKVREIRHHRIRKGERILFKTPNSKRKWDNKPFKEKFVHLSIEAAQYLAQRQIQTVGVDYLSIGGYKGNVTQVHHILLKAGIWAIEGLDLSKVDAGKYEMICLPMKLSKCDGAPARALLRPL